MREASTGARSILICSACGKVRNDLVPEDAPNRWSDLRGYRLRLGLAPDDLALIPTFCPRCQEMLRKVQPDDRVW